MFIYIFYSKISLDVVKGCGNFLYLLKFIKLKMYDVEEDVTKIQKCFLVECLQLNYKELYLSPSPILNPDKASTELLTTTTTCLDKARNLCVC